MDSHPPEESEENKRGEMGRRRRATKACEFCRRRKMRCDGGSEEEPRCTNCRTYSKECNYVELPPKKRPSKYQISTLEAENRALKEQLQAPSKRNEGTPSNSPLSQARDATPFTATSTIAGHAATSAPTTRPRTDLSRPISRPRDHYQREEHAQPSKPLPSTTYTEQPNYYGRTSTLFDDTSAPPRQAQRHDGGRSDKSELQLMGEASKQRQLELLNYKAGRLDFDGVEPELGMHLLNLHWNRQHHSFLITYRPVFMRDMACGGPYFSKLLLNAIYFGASKFSPRKELRSDREHLKSVGQPFRQKVRELLGGALDKSEITTIQALLIMTSSLFALGDERSAAWLYAGTAFRMIIDLGMHVDHISRSSLRHLTEEDIEVRRRVFWGAFVVDKIQSLYQGRPVSLQEADIRVPITFQDQYEELEHWMPFAYSGTNNYPGSPAYSVSTFTQLCKLSIIMNDILHKLYAEKSEKRGKETLAADLNSLQGDLENWELALPTHLQFDSIESPGSAPPPHVLSLQAMHKVLLILLHRPFVSEGHLHSATPSIPANSFVICTKAATQIVQLLRIYDHAFSIQHAPYLMSYATYVSATIHVRIAAQRTSGSEAHSCLSTCLAVFKRNQETNWAVRRAMTVIQNLIKRMNVELPGSPRVEGVNDTRDEPIEANNGAASGPYTTQSMGASDSGVRTISGSGSATDPSHTPELDIDAIIQSFFHEQQSNGYTNLDLPNQFTQGPYGTDLEMMHGRPNGSSRPPQPPFTIDYRDQRATHWNMAEYFPNDNSVEDMLFGFNGPDLDDMA